SSSPSKPLSPTRVTRRTALATSLSSRSSPRKRPAASTPKVETTETPPTTPKKKQRRSKTEGHAEAESYRHVPDLPDNLAPGLILVFIGANPGIKSGLAGHAFSHPTNHFWRRLCLSGITPTVLQPANDVELPEKYQVGRTDLILRTSRLESDIPENERLEAWRVLEEKIRRLKPEAVCVLSKGTWKMMYQGIYGRQMREQDGWEWGWQEGQRIGAEDGWLGSKVWVMPSTSGRVTVPRKEVQEGMWRELGKWVHERRIARGDVVGGVKEED
ncbi:DNA glycosylase, partial [Ascobolus immersus RN42]